MINMALLMFKILSMVPSIQILQSASQLLAQSLALSNIAGYEFRQIHTHKSYSFSWFGSTKCYLLKVNTQSTFSDL